MSRILKPISVNPKKERELFEFLEKHGTKKAITLLFNFYQNNNDMVQNIVDKLKNEIDFTSQSRTITKPKQIELSDDFVVDNDVDDMLSNLIK